MDSLHQAVPGRGLGADGADDGPSVALLLPADSILAERS